MSGPNATSAPPDLADLATPIVARPAPVVLGCAADNLTRGRRLRVLGVGCGAGRAGEAFLERGCEVLGIEVDESPVERARSRRADRARLAPERPSGSGVSRALATRYERHAPGVDRGAPGHDVEADLHVREITVSGRFEPPVVTRHYGRRVLGAGWVTTLARSSEPGASAQSARLALVNGVQETVDALGGHVEVGCDRTVVVARARDT